MIMNEGGGGKKLPTLTNPGTAANLLSGKQLIDQNGEIVTGSMTDRGAVTQALNAGGSYAIPAGYHNGAGKVTANSLSSQTSGTATAADIRSGKTAWVNGSKINGTGQISQIVEFGFLVGDSLYDDVHVYTDVSWQILNGSDSGEEILDGAYYISAGDSSAHTLRCGLGSVVTIIFDSYDDRIYNPATNVVNFERLGDYDNNRKRIFSAICLGDGAIIRVNQR